MSSPVSNVSAGLFPSASALARMAPGLLLIAALLLLFRETATAMVSIWDRSDTFAHAFLVPPLVVWLIWRQRDRLARLPVAPAWWVLLPMAAISLLWLMGALAGVNAATQFALVALIVLSVPAVFGLRLARTLMFPLLFLFFAVPFGEFMVPLMMAWTADFTVAAVQLSGVPVYREGLQFIIPTGSWSVVEACSGVRYLIASFMVGTLFAYLNFKSLGKRLLFVVVSLAVPILANWLRAYMIVMIGHVSGNKLAVGVDHLVYGWVFFGVVIGIMFWIGSRFADPEDPAAELTPHPAASHTGVEPASRATPGLASSPWAVGTGALMVMAVAYAGFWQLNRDVAQGSAPQLAASPQYGNWRLTDQSLSTWTPGFQHARSVAQGSYTDGTHTAALWVGYYRDQGYDKKLISSTNVLASPELESRWASSVKGLQPVVSAGQNVEMTVAEVHASLSAAGAAARTQGQRLRVWHAYWIGDQFVVGDIQARIRLSIHRLLGRGDDAAVVIFYAPITLAVDAQQADGILRSWVGAALPAVSEQLHATRARR
jgi:exosortase A